MNVIVVDSSVAIKWFIPEVQSESARRWREEGANLHTLAVFFDLEIANIVWKKVRNLDLAREDADQILSELPRLPVARHPEGPLLLSASRIAHETQRTVYDCLYVALAEQLDGRMLTADERLYNSLRQTNWSRRICWIAEEPDK